MFLKKIEKEGFIVLFFLTLQPILNFIEANKTDQVFDFNRSIFYFLVIFFASLLIIYLSSLFIKNKNIKI